MDKTVLILPGGGSRGACQFGQLLRFRELVQNAILPKPAAVYATSVGVLNGAMYLQNDLDKLGQLWLNISNDQVYRLAPWKLFTKGNSIYDSSPLKKLIEKNLDFETLRNCLTPFYINTTCLNQWQALPFLASTLTAEYLEQVILASASPPLAFPWVQYGELQLGDGGVTNNFSVVQAVRDGADHLVILNATVMEQTEIKGIPDILQLLFSLPEAIMLHREIDAVMIRNGMPGYRDIKISLVEPKSPTGIGILDFTYNGKGPKASIEYGYRLAVEQLG